MKLTKKYSLDLLVLVLMTLAWDMVKNLTGLFDSKKQYAIKNADGKILFQIELQDGVPVVFWYLPMMGISLYNGLWSTKNVLRDYSERVGDDWKLLLQVIDSFDWKSDKTIASRLGKLKNISFFTDFSALLLSVGTDSSNEDLMKSLKNIKLLSLIEEVCLSKVNRASAVVQFPI